MTVFFPRPYRRSDLERIYEICCRTGAYGGDATGLVENPKLFGELWAAPYVTLEPHSALVLDDGTGQAVGYVLGAADAVAFENRCETEWWPSLRERYPRVEGGERLDDLLIELIHDRPEPRHDLAVDYPSELHIDLLPDAQGSGWGGQLIELLFEQFRAVGSPGVHLGVSVQNTRAVEFYRRLGMREAGCDGLNHTFVTAL